MTQKKEKELTFKCTSCGVVRGTILASESNTCMYPTCGCESPKVRLFNPDGTRYHITSDTDFVTAARLGGFNSKQAAEYFRTRIIELMGEVPYFLNIDASPNPCITHDEWVEIGKLRSHRGIKTRGKSTDKYTMHKIAYALTKKRFDL